MHRQQTSHCLWQAQEVKQASSGSSSRPARGQSREISDQGSSGKSNEPQSEQPLRRGQEPTKRGSGQMSEQVGGTAGMLSQLSAIALGACFAGISCP